MYILKAAAPIYDFNFEVVKKRLNTSVPNFRRVLSREARLKKKYTDNEINYFNYDYHVK